MEALGSENDDTVRERIELTQKLNTLEKGLQDLDAFTVRSGAMAVKGMANGVEGRGYSENHD